MDVDVCFTVSVIVPKMMSAHEHMPQYSLHHSNKVSSWSRARMIKNRAVSCVLECNNKILVKFYTMGGKKKYSNFKKLNKKQMHWFDVSLCPKDVKVRIDKGFFFHSSIRRKQKPRSLVLKLWEWTSVQSYEHLHQTPVSKLKPRDLSLIQILACNLALDTN